jgi:hypothetical protein
MIAAATLRLQEKLSPCNKTCFLHKGIVEFSAIA